MTELLNEEQNNFLVRICDLINNNEITRMGKLFNTDINNYYYDTGTGKVIHLDDEHFYIMNLWFTSNTMTIENILNNDYINLESLLELINICILNS